MTRVVAVDFFCGAGGMTNGLIRAGVHVLAGVDNEALCERTYLQNRNANGARPQFLCHDIFPRTAQYPGGEQHVVIQHIAKLIREYKRATRYRKLHLVFAVCAPCQPFTKITKIQMSDQRQFRRANDASLLLTTCAVIRHFHPEAIICENVEGIADGPLSVLEAFRRRLRRLGYSFDAKVVDASRFGVPQSRKRTIGIGFDAKGYGSSVEIPDCDGRGRRPPAVRDVIGKLPPLAAGEIHPRIPNHRVRSLSDLNLKRISCAKPGESNAYLHRTPYGDLSLSCHRKLARSPRGPSFSDTYTRMRGDDLAPTITTKFISITNGRFGHYDVNQNRALSPREAALLQTFTTRYIFYPEDNLEFTAALIGNAVPPKLARYFGNYIKRRLERKNLGQDQRSQR